MAVFDPADWIWPDASAGRLPQDAVPIRTDHPIFKGLTSAWYGNDVWAFGPTGKLPVGSVSGIGPIGYGRTGFSGANGDLPAGSYGASNAESRFAIVRVPTVTSTNTISSVGVTGAMQVRIASGYELQLVEKGVAVRIRASGAVAAGQYVSIGACRDDTVSELYKNGLLIGSSVGRAGVVTATPHLGLDSGANPFNDLIFLHFAWNRRLSAEEWRAIDEYVRLAFAPVSVPMSFGSSGGGDTPISLTGANSSQANLGATGVVTQVHALSGANASQVNAGSTGTITGTLILSGAAGSQANTASSAAVSQTHLLVGASSSQVNSGSTGAVSEIHSLSGANSSQVNTGSTGSIGGNLILSGSSSSQANSGATGAVSQSHSLVGESPSQSNLAAVGAVAQVHGLIGANATQVNVGATGSIAGTIILSGSAGAQANSSSSGAIGQTHQLVGTSGSQTSVSPGGSISQAHVLAGADSTQANLGSTAALGEVTLTLTGAAGSQTNSGSVGNIAQAHKLVSAPSVQDNIASASAIVQAYMLSAANGVQTNLGSIGPIVINGVAYWPTPDQVLAGVTYGPTGVEYTGTLVPGSSGGVVDSISFYLQDQISLQVDESPTFTVN